MYASLVPRVIFPLYEGLSGRRFWTEFLRLRALQWQTPEELEARALRNLRPLLAHAAGHVPYYRDLFMRVGVQPEDLRTLADLTYLPITSKAELRRNHPDRTTADNLPVSRQWRTLTSGSTGFPFEFYTDAASGDGIVAGYLFFLDWSGAAIWNTRVDIGNARNLPISSILPKSPRVVQLARRMLLGERVVGLGGIDLSPDEFLARVGDISPTRGYFIRGYPSYVARLAARLLQEGTELPAYPQVVINSGEMLTAVHANTIERAFRCRVVNQYSAWEVPHMAQTCPDNPGVFHVNSERVILRVVRDDGSPAGSDERGRILITALANYVMPFINYDMGDSGINGGPCPCGRGFPTLMGLEGRLGEVIRTPGGRIISPVTLGILLKFVVPYVWEYQAVQAATDTVTLLVVPTSRFTPGIATILQADLEKLLGAGMKVRIEPVDQIPPEPSGKRLVIRSHLGGT